MSQSKNKASSSNPARNTIVLASGDLLVLLLFAIIGRRSHSLSVADIGADLTTAAPFIISWFLITPWFGLFRPEVSQNWRKLVPRLLLAWVIIGCPVALLLRALWLGRAIPGGIPLSFAGVALAVTTLFTLVWRLGYLGWVNQRTAEARQDIQA